MHLTATEEYLAPPFIHDTVFNLPKKKCYQKIGIVCTWFLVWAWGFGSGFLTNMAINP
jgi:hypothetical protein